jgi:hypothetical protein
MNAIKERKRWPLALIVVAAVVLVSAAMIYSFHDTQGRIPVSAISDGSNGVLVTWQKDEGIYAQRVDSSGQAIWRKGGVLICECQSASSSRLNSDGLGGAIITWSDESIRPGNSDDPAFFDPVPFYAQRISTDGELLWEDSPISSGKNRQVVTDGNGGTIIAWNNYDVYHKGLTDDYLHVQKIDPDGRRLWGKEGVLVVASSPYRPLTPEEVAGGLKGTITRSHPTYEGTHDIVSDGAGGAIVLWEEETESGDHKIYAQRLDAEGNTAWPERITAAHGSYYHDYARSDGAGGALFTASEVESGATHLHHIDATGEMLRTETFYPGSISDGRSGIIQVRIEAEPSIGPPWEQHSLLYVRRLYQQGYPYKLVLSTPEKEQIHEIDFAADGTGGIVLAWQLSKEGIAYGGIFAQRLDAEGNICWTEGGMPVFTAPELKYQGGAIVIGSRSGSVIVVAAAGDNALGGDRVYAQRLDVDGSYLWNGGIRLDR